MHAFLPGKLQKPPLCRRPRKRRPQKRQKKKLLLARSLCTPAHLYVWDEPLNYIDVYSRRQVEELILQSQPTLLLVEHDAVFLEKVCTRPAVSLTRE